MNGDVSEAARYAERALALGIANALFLFHAGHDPGCAGPR